MAAEFKSLGFALISWIEHYLVHGPGDIQGQPIELDDEFAEFVVKAYRVHPRTGVRFVRRSFFSRAKGRAKSELAGMLDCVEALGPCRFDHFAEAGEVSPWGYEYDEGEPVGAPLVYVEILNVATEEGQAGNTYDNAYYMLHPDTCSPNLLADYGRIDVGLTRINLPGRRGSIEIVTASNESKDGGKSTFIVADETHLWIPPAKGKFTLGKMHQTMARNLLKRKIASGWMLETSTMYAAGEGSVAEGTHAYAKSPAGRGGKLLFDHRQASDGFDFTKRADRLAALREAYGPAAAWMPLGDIADSYDDPQVDPREWERFWTNRPVPLVKESPSALPKWIGCASLDDPPAVTALGVAVGYLSGWGALVAAGVRDDGKIHVDVGESPGGELHFREGDGWMVAEAKRIQDATGCAVLLDEKGPAAHLVKKFTDADVALTLISASDFIESCGVLADLVDKHEVTHGGSIEMQSAVDGAAWRAVGDRRVLARKNSRSDIAPLEGAALAVRGAQREVEPSVYFI